jgi:hypothetical protein
MGHINFNNAFDFGINQPRNYNNLSAEQPNIPIGPVPSENRSSISQMDNNNTLSSGSNTEIHWNPESRAHEYSSSNFGMQTQNLPPHIPAQSYSPYPHTSVVRNVYPGPHINTSHIHNNHYNRRPFTHDAEGTFVNSTAEASGAHKRKRPSYPEDWERGIYSGAGSSSGSSQMRLENPSSNYQTTPQGPIVLSQHVPAEDSIMRNVRSRPSLYIEPQNLPNYPSHHRHSITYPRNPTGMFPVANPNADVINREWTHVPLSAPPRGRRPASDFNGSSYEANRFIGGGSGGEIGSCHHEFVPVGHHISSSQYIHGPGGNYQSGRPFHRTNLSYSQLGHESSMDYNNGLNIYHPENQSYRYSRPASVGSFHNGGFRNGGRSRTPIERFHSVAGMVNSGPEFVMVGDHSQIYDGTRPSHDQYREMRLDVDSMSYEELVALGERIGDVSTGVSEDVMPNCLVDKIYCSTHQKNQEEKCAICLEEYEGGEEIGEVKNCGHEFHGGCIKKWLLMKNVCPICKTAALKNHSDY